MKWIRAYAIENGDRKTLIWRVESRDAPYVKLGEVRFYPQWRKYCFFPADRTLFEPDCLRDIAQFCEDKTVEWRQSCRQRTKSSSPDNSASSS